MRLLQCLALVLAACGAAALFHELSMSALAPPRALPRDSFFGYSIAYDFKSKRVVSSAPRADNVGHVYSCDVATGFCSKLNVMNEKDISLRPPKYSNHSFWLGATVNADTSNLMICAPRHTNKMPMRNGHMHFATYGSCYAKNLQPGPSDNKFELLQKIKLKERQQNVKHNEDLTDSFGWSIDFAADNLVRVGGPAMSSGRVITYDLDNPAVAPSLLIGSASESKVNYNFGYSIASGNYFSMLPSYAVSTPYGEIGKGKVLFFEEDKYNWAIVDDEVGSLFGAALCSAHLNNSRSSLLIGAPAYFLVDGAKDRYHTGIVYVYVPHSSYYMKLAKKIEGPKDGGFFGNSIANVGDTDKDGMDEIVIAAPHEDDGAGAVYLYSGAALLQGGATRWLQRLQPEGFRGFGLSLTAFNYTDNGCKDLAIGAPGNDKVAVYHCLAVISDVQIQAEFPDMQRRTDKTSFVFTCCLKAKLPEKPILIEASFNVTVKILHPNATLAENPSKRYTILRREPRPCHKIKVMTNKDGDYERPIRFHITAELVEDPLLSKHFDSSKATLEPRRPLAANFQVSAAECRNTICSPKLSLDVESSLKETYVTGSSEAESLRVVVRNGAGDAAYLPCARARVAGGAAVARAPAACAWAGLPQERLCQLQGTLGSHKLWNISETSPLILDMTSLTSGSKALRLSVDVFSRCGDAVPAQSWALDVALRHDNGGVRLHGKTDQGEVVNVTKMDIQAGKRIQHTYTIRNTQGTNWKSLVCKIWLKKEAYVEFDFPIQIYRDGSVPVPACLPGVRAPTDGSYTLSCLIGDLFRKDTVTIIIPIHIPPGKLVNIYDKINATVQTSITLQFNKKSEDIKHEVTTTLTLQQAAVPLWIILAAGAVGVLLVLLLAFAMYECGCLRRKNKEMLENLKTEVKRKSRILHRKSMRLSDTERESLRNRTYRELLDEAEAEESKEGCLDTRDLPDHSIELKQLEPPHQPEEDQAVSSMSDKKNLIEYSLKMQMMKNKEQ